jgi:hypothetical protein
MHRLTCHHSLGEGIIWRLEQSEHDIVCPVIQIFIVCSAVSTFATHQNSQALWNLTARRQNISVIASEIRHARRTRSCWSRYQASPTVE